jgi:hypothetical protein
MITTVGFMITVISRENVSWISSIAELIKDFCVAEMYEVAIFYFTLWILNVIYNKAKGYDRQRIFK